MFNYADNDYLIRTNGGPVRGRGRRGRGAGSEPPQPKEAPAPRGKPGAKRERQPRAAKPKPKTAEDLDKELDAFMGGTTPAAAADKDVEMS